MTLQEIRAKINKINTEKKQGVLHYLPLPSRLSRLNNLIGGIGKEDYMLITSVSGGSKSTFMHDITINAAKELINNNPDLDIKIKLFINILEESVESMRLRDILSKMSFRGHNNIDIRQLQGRRWEAFDDYMLNVINESITDIETEEEKISDKLDIVWSSEPNPFGFYKKIRQYAYENGTFYLDGNVVNKLGGAFDSYVPNNSNELVIAVSDHLKLYSAESGKGWRESIEYFSQKYCRQILNLKLGYSVINVQQQASSSEAIIFDRNGKPIIQNTYPSLNKLGDITTTQREALIAFGIWNPHKHNVETQTIGGLTIPYAAFQEKGLQIRNIFVLKNRYTGAEGSILPCLVDYKKREFTQLPKNQVEINKLLK